MKILKIQQNSEEWLEFRRGKSGGSEFGGLFPTKSPLKSDIVSILESKGIEFKKTDTVGVLLKKLEPQDIAVLKLEMDLKDHYYELLAHSVARDLTPNDYADRIPNIANMSKLEFAAARGHLLESEARKAVSDKLKIQFEGENEVWVSDECDDIYVSPDGWKTDDDGKIRVALEIKCLNSIEIIKANRTGKYPDKYYPQVCKYFMVNDNLETLYFAMYTDLIPGLELQLWKIERRDVASDIKIMKIFEHKIMERLRSDREEIERLGF